MLEGLNILSSNYDVLRDSRILVVGASGFLGNRLLRALCQLEAYVIAVSRRSEPSQIIAKNTVWQKCDASDLNQVTKLFQNFKPDIVYQLSSDSQGAQDIVFIPSTIKNDFITTVNLLTEAVQCGVGRLVMTGSLEEPIGEARNAVPSSPYAAAKWASCAYARMFSTLYSLPVTVLRLMMIYGPGQKDYKVVPYTIQTLLDGQVARLTSCNRLLDWVYVDDVIDAFLRAGTTPITDARSIDIGTGELTRLRDLLTLIGELVGRPDLLAFGDIADRTMEREEVADIRDAVQKLGWRAETSIREGLFRTIEAYRSDRSSVRAHPKRS